MKKFILYLIIATFSCCSTFSEERDWNDNTKFYREKVNLNTQNQEIIAKFDLAQNLADSIVKKVVEKNHLADFSIQYYFQYKNGSKLINDTLLHMPIYFRFDYGLKIGNDTIKAAIIQIHPTLKVDFAEVNILLGFKGFLTNKLKLGPKELNEIAKKNGIDPDNAWIEFDAATNMSGVQPIVEINPFTTELEEYERSLVYYWEVKSKCDGCNTITVDAKNGVILSRGKVIYY